MRNKCRKSGCEKKGNPELSFMDTAANRYDFCSDKCRTAFMDGDAEARGIKIVRQPRHPMFDPESG